MKHLPGKKNIDTQASAKPVNQQRLSVDGSAMSLQRQLGNGLMHQVATAQGPLVQRACSCGGSCASCSSQDEHVVQAKLTVGPANDRYEREADRVAQQVVGMSNPPVESSQAPAASIQRMGGASGGTNASVSSLPMGESRPLSRATRQFMEPRFGADFSNVRVHNGPKSESTAQNIHARAFTHQNHIWLGKGAAESDRSLMAHELTHVVQQGASNTVQRSALDASQGALSGVIQRDPPPERCPDGEKVVSVDLVTLPGSNRDPHADLAFANTVFSQCCVRFELGTGVSVNPADASTWLGGDTTLTCASSCGTVATEYKDMVDGARSLYGVGSRFQIFYVETMTPGARAMDYPPFCATGPAAPYVDTMAVSNAAGIRTLAHEFGHILLNGGNGLHTSHAGGTDNLMEPTNTSTGSNLEPSQCVTIRGNA